MDHVKNTIYLLIAVLTLSLGIFPPGSVICQAVDGKLIIESSCDCDTKVPPCCKEQECEREEGEHSQQETLSVLNDCNDTIISNDQYTSQDTILISKSFTTVSFQDYITLIVGCNYPIDVGKGFYIDPPHLLPSNLNIVNTTVLII